MAHLNVYDAIVAATSLEVSHRASSLVGLVTSARPVDSPGAFGPVLADTVVRLYYIPDTGPLHLLGHEITCSRGHFKFTGLAPGRYALRFLQEGYQALVKRPIVVDSPGVITFLGQFSLVASGYGEVSGRINRGPVTNVPPDEALPMAMGPLEMVWPGDTIADIAPDGGFTCPESIDTFAIDTFAIDIFDGDIAAFYTTDEVCGLLNPCFPPFSSYVWSYGRPERPPVTLTFRQAHDDYGNALPGGEGEIIKTYTTIADIYHVTLPAGLYYVTAQLEGFITDTVQIISYGGYDWGQQDIALSPDPAQAGLACQRVQCICTIDHPTESTMICLCGNACCVNTQDVTSTPLLSDGAGYVRLYTSLRVAQEFWYTDESIEWHVPYMEMITRLRTVDSYDGSIKEYTIVERVPEIYTPSSSGTKEIGWGEHDARLLRTHQLYLAPGVHGQQVVAIAQMPLPLPPSPPPGSTGMTFTHFGIVNYYHLSGFNPLIRFMSRCPANSRPQNEVLRELSLFGTFPLGDICRQVVCVDQLTTIFPWAGIDKVDRAEVTVTRRIYLRYIGQHVFYVP